MTKSHFANTKKHIEDDHTFDSKAELRRYHELKLLLRRGEITDLQVHPRYILNVNGERVSSYKPDFEYISYGVRVVEDVKPFKKQGKYKIMRPWVKPYDKLRHKMFAAQEGVNVTYIK
jgi:hypothetical protein